MFHVLRRRADYNAAALTPHTTNSSRLRAARAFTLIELIVVVVILGVLASIGAVAYNQFVGSARDTAVLASATDIAHAVDAAATQAGTSAAAVLATTTYADGTLTLPNGVKSAVAGGVLVTTGAGSFTITDGDSCSQIAGSDALTTVSTCAAGQAGDQIAIDGITGGYAVPVGTTGYTLHIPGLTPSTSYTASLDVGDPMWTPSLTATSGSDGVGTFAITFETPETGAALVSVAVTALSNATNFADLAVTFGATTDTTPVAVPGRAGATIAGDGTTGYVLHIDGLSANTEYSTNPSDGVMYGALTYATSNGTGQADFAVASAEGGPQAGATQYFTSASAAPTGANAAGTFTGRGVAPPALPQWNLVLAGNIAGQTYYAPGYLALALSGSPNPAVVDVTFLSVYTGVDPTTDADAAWTGYMAGSPQDACTNLRATYPELTACSWAPRT